MGARGGSGLYVGRGTAALLAALLLSLLAALLALAALYGRCRHPPPPARPAAAPGPDPGVPGAPTGVSLRRLPRHLLPLHYELELWPRVRPGQEEPFGFSGQVNITVRCRRDTRSAVLHSAGLKSHRAAVRGPLPQAGAAVEVEGLRLEEESELAVLELREPLLAGRRYVLQLSFHGRLREDREGLFLTRYTDLGCSSMLVASQLEPAYARTVYPCFDEPDMKATFNIRIVHDPSYVALSNMPVIDVSEMKDENGSLWSVTTFNTSLKMPTYLTAFVVCDFDYVNTTERGKEIRIWARKEAVKNGYVDYALNITGPIFSFLEDLFNISYPLPKTDLVALPDFGAGAMENWGLMTFEEAALLYLPSDKFTGRRMIIALIVSHELAHQWFGNLVTMTWWNDLWLKEGLASYLENLGATFVEPKLSLHEIFYDHIVQPVLSQENDLEVRSLSESEDKVNGSFSLLSLFDSITYNKGASITWMLSGFLTEKLFTRALNSYLREFAFSNANQDDLWIHIQLVVDAQDEVQLPASVKKIMDSWTCQNGFPVLTFNISTGTISQEKFHNKNHENSTDFYNNTWIVPISWMRNGSSQPLMWLDNSSKVFPEMQVSDSEYDWILLNVNLSGYYRVNYDQLNLKRLVHLLENDPKAIPAVSRFQLLDDIFALTRSGYIEIEAALELTKYLGGEDKLFVWNVVLVNLVPDNVESTLKNYEVYPLLKKYLLKRMLPIYHYYAGFIRRNVDALEDDYFAQVYLEKFFATACWLGLRDCLDLSSELYTNWMDNPEYKIPFLIRRTVCCYGVAVGSDKEWDFAWKMYKQNDSTTEDKDILLSAMSCAKESWLLHRSLRYWLSDTQFSSNCTANILEYVVSKDNGHRIAWEFVTENWSLLNERYGKELLHAVLRIMGRFVSTDIQIQELQVFYNNTLEEDERETATLLLETAKAENVERKELLSRVADWLDKNIDD
ncbi:aminopeptidase Q [Tympanuchus pallidicinctus]|uniref:aminopeptidase Q n=1 Tax=Tympanuchus pallidicinctus TaxID=109042 RepID=UPI002286D634|nr:aminopeptidase Q [Tympanuchus pallidicinctus]